MNDGEVGGMNRGRRITQCFSIRGNTKGLQGNLAMCGMCVVVTVTVNTIDIYWAEAQEAKQF